MPDPKETLARFAALYLKEVGFDGLLMEEAWDTAEKAELIVQNTEPCGDPDCEACPEHKIFGYCYRYAPGVAEAIEELTHE